MYFSKETLATNSRLGGHWNELWANRNMWNAQHDAMIAANRSNMTPEWLAVSACPLSLTVAHTNQQWFLPQISSAFIPEVILETIPLRFSSITDRYLSEMR